MGTSTWPFGMALGEALPGLQPGRQDCQALAGHGADDALAQELLPPAFRGAVVHHEIGIAQLARGAELQRHAVDAPVEDNGGVAERAIGHGHRDAADAVVDDLVPGQNAEGIGLGFAVNLEPDHRLPRAQISDRRDGLEFRIVDRRDAVLGRAAAHDLAKVHRGLREVGLGPFVLPVIGIGAGTGAEDKPDRRGGQDEEGQGASICFLPVILMASP